MPKLKLSEWANVSEIVASIVIVASLAYIGMELNQNTQALQTDSYQTMTGILIELDVAQALSEDLNRIIMLAEASPSDISAEEWERFTHIAFARFGLWEYLLLSYQDDSISGAQWAAFEPYLRGYACKRGYKRFWEEKQFAFSIPFKEYFGSEVLPTCGESQP